MMNRIRAVAGLFAFVAAAAILFKGVFLLIDIRDRKSDRNITIGSKAFTEGIVLAEIMAVVIEKRTGLTVVRRTNLGGTHICFQALRAGEIDLYPEYTGTGLMAILEQPVVNDERRALRIVREAFDKRYRMVWLDPLGFNNTYALAMTEKKARELGIQRISDLAHHPELRAGFTSEFMARKDGYPGLKQLYGFSFTAEPGSMEAGLMYSAVAEAKVDVVSAYSTDGRITKFKLVLLDDDKHFFPPYQAAALIRRQALDRHPELETALSPLAGKLDDEQMRNINARIDLGGEKLESVAAEIAQQLLAARSGRTKP
jgi:glycine betaine/choline ABC-type transport system substrate-binding protein